MSGVLVGIRSFSFRMCQFVDRFDINMVMISTRRHLTMIQLSLKKITQGGYEYPSHLLLRLHPYQQ